MPPRPACPLLGGIAADYLRMTGLSNWGGICYGLSEVRFYTIQVVPEPSTSALLIVIGLLSPVRRRRR